MDEPFSSLDYATKQSLYAYLLSLQKSISRTVILVTHDLEEAMKIADAFIWIEKGMLRDKGPVAKLNDIRNDYLAG